MKWNEESSMRKIGSFLNTLAFTYKLNTLPAYVLEYTRKHMNYNEGVILVDKEINTVDSLVLLIR
jgi:hypothetical protein